MYDDLSKYDVFNAALLVGADYAGDLEFPVIRPTSYIPTSLDPDNPRAKGKAEAYRRGLGYTKANAESLIERVHEAVSSGTAKPYEVQKDDYGVKFKFRIQTKNVIAVYQIDKGTTSPRMVTNYLEGR